MSLYAVITILVFHQASSLSPSAVFGTLKGISDDGLQNFTEMAATHGHKAKEHTIVTEDGYILTLFNLPGDKKKPILMSHGVFDSADGWILRGKTSLAIFLADEGYDVWLLNQRGSRYSRQHETLNPDSDAKFWDFSVHELGCYDLPANIDYILNATGQPQLSVIGFSEGTTMMYVLAALKPEYNDKVKVFISLAPIAFLQNARGLLRILINLGSFLNAIIPASINEIGGFYSISKVFLNLICTQLGIGYNLCFGGFMNPLIGPHFESIEKSFFEVIVGHFPAGTSKKNLIHFSQIGTSGSFAAYDYGASKNLEIYGSLAPPGYDLTKVTLDVVFVSGENDRVSTLEDVNILKSKLPNFKEWMIVEDPLFNHLDHLWANDAHKRVYPFVMDTLAKYH